MAFDIGSVGGMVMKYAITPLFWLIALIVVFGGMILILWIRKKRALRFTGIEITEYGGFNTVPCGWMGLKWYFKGLWTTGRNVMTTDLGEVIEEFSEADFREINGERGLCFYRDPTNKRLFPISKIQLDPESKKMILKVPPAEYIENALRIIDDSSRETEDRVTNITKAVLWGLMIIGALITIIVIVQYVKSAQVEASKLVMDAGKTCLESAKSVCSTITSEIIKSGAP